MHDPFQTYAALGSYYGMQPQSGLPYQALQTSGFNPSISQSPFGQFGQGQGPQQWQLLSALASHPAVPQLLAALLSNPQIAAGLHSGGLANYGQQSGGQQFGAQQHSTFGQPGSPFGQMGSPFGQQGSPFGQMGSPLAPQSWIGQGYGGIHPLQALLGGRQFQPQGFTPWGY